MTGVEQASGGVSSELKGATTRQRSVGAIWTLREGVQARAADG